MITTAQELLPKPQKMKPILTKSLQTLKASFLSLSNKRKEKLRSLSIDENTWRSIQVDPKTLTCLRKVLKTSKLLRKFKLDANLIASGDHLRKKRIETTLVRIIEGLKSHSALVDADFFFGDTKKIENTMRIVTKGVGHVLGKLRHFAYKTCFCTSIREKFSSPANKGLKRLPFLEKMTLMTPWFTENNLPAFHEWENRLFVCKNLKELSLDVRGDSNEILARITNQLQRFSRLKKLSINFILWNKLKIENVIELIEIISHMPSLKSLYLGFPSYTNFTDDWMKVICEALAKISTITKLKLNFESCQKIKTKGIVLLSKYLKEIGQQLTCVELNFSRCSNVNAEGMRLLGETFNGMNSLRKVHIILECCQMISIEIVEFFMKDFEDKSISLKVSYQKSRNDTRISRENKKSVL